MSIRIVLVSYFGARDAAKAVASLQTGALPDLEIIVADNSQGAEELRVLRELESSTPHVRVYASSTNLGYFGAARAVLATAGRPADWTIVANTDLIFGPGFLETLTRMPPTAVLAPSVRPSPTGPDQNPYLLSRPGRAARLRWRLAFSLVPVARLYLLLDYWLRRLLPQRTPEPAPAGTAMYAPHGCCVVLPRSYFESGGTLEHPTLLFAEEITLGEACRRLGIPVVQAPALRITHTEHASTGKWRSTHLLRMQRDSIRYANSLLSAGD